MLIKSADNTSISAFGPWVGPAGPPCPGLCGEHQDREMSGDQPWGPQQQTLSQSEGLSHGIAFSSSRGVSRPFTEKSSGAARGVHVPGNQETGLRVQEMENRRWRDFVTEQGLWSEMVV